MDSLSTYYEYIKIAHLLESLLHLHYNIYTTLPVIKDLTLILNNNQEIMKKFISQYPSMKAVYDYSHPKYLSKVSVHYSLLSGYATLLTTYKNYGYFKRLTQLKEVNKAITLFKDYLSASLILITDIPKLSKPKLININLEGQISSDIIKDNQFISVNTFSPTIAALLKNENLLEDCFKFDQYPKIINPSSFKLNFQTSILNPCGLAQLSDSITIKTLTSDEIKIFIHECLYSNNL